MCHCSLFEHYMKTKNNLYGINVFYPLEICIPVKLNLFGTCKAICVMILVSCTSPLGLLRMLLLTNVCTCFLVDCTITLLSFSWIRSVLCTKSWLARMSHSNSPNLCCKWTVNHGIHLRFTNVDSNKEAAATMMMCCFYESTWSLFLHVSYDSLRLWTLVFCRPDRTLEKTNTQNSQINAPSRTVRGLEVWQHWNRQYHDRWF